MPTPKRLREYATSPMAFFDDAFTARGLTMAPFQRERFSTLAPAFVAIANGEKPECGRFLWEGSKGSSKDTDLAIACLWLCAFATVSVDGQVSAVDFDQCCEMRKAARSWVNALPWLADRIKILTDRIVCDSTDCCVAFVPADAAGGAHGSRCLLYILNEVSHAARSEHWQTQLDNATKVDGVVIVAQNPGFIDTDAWKLREMARQSPRWTFHQFAKPAPWINLDELEETRLRVSSERFMRLWYGVWSNSDGDCLDGADIDAACVLSGPAKGNEPYLRGTTAIAGLDLGLSKNHAAFVILNVADGSERIRVSHLRSWKPPKDGQVDFAAVEAHILEHHKKFNIWQMRFDPWNGAYLAQRIRRKTSMIVQECRFTAKNCDEMAMSLQEVFRQRQISMWRDNVFIQDLQKLSVEDRGLAGQRITAVTDKKTGSHADLATAFLCALPLAREISHSRPLGDRSIAKAASSFKYIPSGRRFGLMADEQWKGGRRVFHPPGWGE